jgi:hypothetical protein
LIVALVQFVEDFVEQNYRAHCCEEEICDEGDGDKSSTPAKSSTRKLAIDVSKLLSDGGHELRDCTVDGDEEPRPSTSGADGPTPAETSASLFDIDDEKASTTRTVSPVRKSRAGTPGATDPTPVETSASMFDIDDDKVSTNWTVSPVRKSRAETSGDADDGSESSLSKLAITSGSAFKRRKSGLASTEKKRRPLFVAADDQESIS